MLIKLISPLVAVLVFIVLPLWLIARRAKAGKSVKKPLIANLCGFFLGMFATAVVFLGQGVAPATDAADASAAVGVSARPVPRARGVQRDAPSPRDPPRPRRPPCSASPPYPRP